MWNVESGRFDESYIIFKFKFFTYKINYGKIFIAFIIPIQTLYNILRNIC